MLSKRYIERTNGNDWLFFFHKAQWGEENAYRQEGWAALALFFVFSEGTLDDDSRTSIDRSFFRLL